MRNKKIFILYPYVRIHMCVVLLHFIAPYRDKHLTVETKMRVKINVSFHTIEPIVPIVGNETRFHRSQANSIWT